MCVGEKNARVLRMSCSAKTRRGDAGRDGPVWLQRHRCEFVTDVMLEARGGKHTNAN